jgi:hypothetical protein
MKTEENTFICSIGGVRVYLKPEFHPLLKGADLLHPDFVRKSKEVFSNALPGVQGLPRICSENSEDALTWANFSPLLSVQGEKKKRILTLFLEQAIKRPLDEKSLGALQDAKLLFWRGKKEKPFYSPPPTFEYPEANTEVDLTIRFGNVVIFVEAKYHSEISMSTTYWTGRDQIIRNVDVGTYYAWSNGLDFYFILITTSESCKSVERLKYYKDHPENIAKKLLHRTDVSSSLDKIAKNLGWTTWDKLGATK